MNIKTSDDIKSILCKENWGICIGAGTSFPVFPTWNSLVKELISEDKSISNHDKISNSLLKQFSPDSLIQAVQNILNLSDLEFAKLLSTELYKELKSNISPEEWNSVKIILESHNPHSEQDPNWNNFIKVRERIFSKTSAYQIAKFVDTVIKEDLAPKCIISFNAESLLYSLINSFQREPFLGRLKKKGELKKVLERITHTISPERKGRIPYIYCHGLLLAPLSKIRSPLLTDNDKLVFSENAYLSLANNSYSWQSNEFINYCSKITLVFIGVSLTDPNMRRWLSWVHSLKLHELRQNKIVPENIIHKVYSHFWINKEPKSTDEKKWIEACVQHLGVKVVWIRDWDKVGDKLNEMIGK